jgi:hypothetical protein
LRIDKTLPSSRIEGRTVYVDEEWLRCQSCNWRRKLGYTSSHLRRLMQRRGQITDVAMRRKLDGMIRLEHSRIQGVVPERNREQAQRAAI